MRQFFLKSVLSLSLSVGAVAASTNSTDLSDPVAPSASSSTSSTSLALTVQTRHPASFPMPCIRDIEDENGEVIAQDVDIGFLKAAAQETPFVMQEILSHLDFKDCFNLYKAGYINGFMWKAVEGKRDFLNADNVPHKLLLVALAIQTKDPKLFIQDQGRAFGQLNLTSLREIFDSGDLRGYLESPGVMMAKYSSHRRSQGTISSQVRQNFRLIPPQKNWVDRNLDFSENHLTVLADLEWSTHLQNINVSNNKLMVLPNFSTVQNLRSVSAYSNRLRTLTGLGQQTNLQTLNLTQNELTDLPGIEQLVGLQNLQVAYNNLTGSLDLSNLTQLFNLSLEWNQLTEVKDIEGMTNLNGLGLAGHPLRNVPSFRSFQHLRSLVFAHMGFTALQNIGDLPHLFVLNLAGNGLVNLDSCPDLPSLKFLFIENNLLTSVEPLTRLPKLDVLHISGNPMDTLISLRNMTALYTLQIQNMTRLTSLSTMPMAIRGRLDSLSLFGNSFTHLPELADMGQLHKVSLTKAQWENTQNRSYLTTLIQNDIDGRGPTVFIPVIHNALITASVCVRDRNVGAHGAPIN